MENKTCLGLCCLLVFCSYTNAAEFIVSGSNNENTGCVIGSSVFTPDQMWRSGFSCVLFTCLNLSGDYMGKTCPVVEPLSQTCTLYGEDLTKHYPGCCQKYICPGLSS